MKVLHICSYYIGNKLYMNLARNIAKYEVEQHIFVPVRSQQHLGINEIFIKGNKLNYYYKNILTKSDKFLYFKKIQKQMREVETSILSKNNIDVIHAHTVFSDGGTAYKLHKKYNLDYIVTVRNTDINTFYKYGIHLRGFMYKVLLNAKNIVFISYAYQKKMFSLLPDSIIKLIKSKCRVIPNGIDDYWHLNTLYRIEENDSSKFSLVFIGEINKNKNLNAVISSCAALRLQGYDATLSIIGTGKLETKAKELSTKLGMDKYIVFHGHLTSREKIYEILKENHIFVMPSFKETFGLVYIEAMSNGVPVIYSENQGIDGFFEDGKIGFAVNPFDVKTIVESIKKINLNYKNMSVASSEAAGIFNWTDITKEYITIYKSEE